MAPDAHDTDAAKRLAARRALDFVEDGMRLGLGTGSTASVFVELLAERVAAGLKVVGVPTSARTGALAAGRGISVAELDDLPELDLTVDGADEYDPALRLIKGGGGALLREKIIASASARMIVIADWTKSSPELGRFPLPVEVDRFGLVATRAAVIRQAERCGCTGAVSLRGGAAAPFVTDGGHLILDCSFGRIPEPEALASGLAAVPGVVEHGLFLGIATAVISAGPEGVTILGHPDAR